MSLVKSFEACTFTPSVKGVNGMPPLIKAGPGGTFTTTSFFIDSSGHSNLILPLELKFASQEDLDLVLASKSIVPAPSNFVQPEDDEAKAEKAGEDPPAENETKNTEIGESSFIGFEARSSSVDGSSKVAVVVEAISILSTSVEGLVVSFETEVTVRASAFDKFANKGSDSDVSSVAIKVEITPILTVKEDIKSSGASALGVPDLLSLELGAIPDHMQKESSSRVLEARLGAVTLDVTLTRAFTISVRSIQGATLGTTMVSLTIRHSSLHRESVTINNIAIHPGHSRYETISNADRNKYGSKYAVTNMTKAVQWGYAPQTELRLPLTLNPYDAYSTVLVMHAGEEMQSRVFTSPISVTGIVGSLASQTSSSSRRRLVVAADVHWSTELVAVEPADAFRIDMKVKDSEVKLGEPMVVNLRIFNLSLEPRNLMLIMAKEEHQGATERDEIVNAAVVSEINGYTFGVWGISGEDDGTVRLNRDNTLLAVDGALLLGEVLGQHAVDAELRFVPLREGCLKVPYWKLYDKTTGIWYTCAHNLSLVARNSSE